MWTLEKDKLHSDKYGDAKMKKVVDHPMSRIWTINIVDELSPDLMLRDIASSFMDWIESQYHHAVMIDFSGVESITRTFAHEYVSRRNRSPLDIQEINVPLPISRMFSIINDSERKPRFEKLNNTEVIEL